MNRLLKHRVLIKHSNGTETTNALEPNIAMMLIYLSNRDYLSYDIVVKSENFFSSLLTEHMAGIIHNTIRYT